MRPLIEVRNWPVRYKVAGILAVTLVPVIGIMLLYLANFAMGFFGHSIGFINGSSGVGIAFSAVVVVIAALNLILDFDLIETGAHHAASGAGSPP